MKKIQINKNLDDMEAEYFFDYKKAKPNRFATPITKDRMIVLDPDIAEIFTTSASVNTVLRALIKTMPRIKVKK